MASTEQIAAYIELAIVKRGNLRKTLDDLQSHSSLLSSLAVQWKDLEDQFDLIQRSIEKRFKELEFKEKGFSGNLNQAVKVEQSELPLDNPIDSTPLRWPELRSLCVKMDGQGLQLYLNEHFQDQYLIKEELFDALGLARDPARLVLDGIRGFYKLNKQGDIPSRLRVIRKSCILLMDQLIRLSPEIKPLVRDEAMRLAAEWKKNKSSNQLEILGFLHLLAAYGLTSAFEVDEVFKLFEIVSERQQNLEMCQALGFALGFADRMSDFIQSLITKNKRIEAVKFIYGFGLVDKYQPIPLLKSHLKHSNKHAKKICKSGNNSILAQNKALEVERAALSAIITCIEDYKLENQYPPENLKNRLLQLKEQINQVNPTAAVMPPEGPKKQKQKASSSNSQPRKQTANKRPRVDPSHTAAQPPSPTVQPTDATVTSISATQLVQPSVPPHWKPSGSTPDQGGMYLTATSAPAGSYSLSVPSHCISHAGSSAQQYGPGYTINGNTGHVGSGFVGFPGAQTFGGFSPGASPNTISYYPQDALRTRSYYNGPVPNGSSGYLQSQYPPPHPAYYHL